MLCPIRIYPLEVAHNLGTWRNQCLLKKKKGNALFPILGHFFTTASTRVSQKDCSLILAQHAANGGWCGYQIFAVQEQGSLWISLASESFTCNHPKSLLEQLASEPYVWSHCTTSILGAAVQSVHQQGFDPVCIVLQTWLSQKKWKSTTSLCMGVGGWGGMGHT